MYKESESKIEIEKYKKLKNNEIKQMREWQWKKYRWWNDKIQIKYSLWITAAVAGIVTTTEGALDVEVEVATAPAAGADDEDDVAPVDLAVAVTAALLDAAAGVGTAGTIFWITGVGTGAGADSVAGRSSPMSTAMPSPEGSEIPIGGASASPNSSSSSAAYVHIIGNKVSYNDYVYEV